MKPRNDAVKRYDLFLIFLLVFLISAVTFFLMNISGVTYNSSTIDNRVLTNLEVDSFSTPSIEQYTSDIDYQSASLLYRAASEELVKLGIQNPSVTEYIIQSGVFDPILFTAGRNVRVNILQDIVAQTAPSDESQQVPALDIFSNTNSLLVYEPFFNFLVETPFLVNEQFYFNILPAFSFTIPLQEVQIVDINQIFNISINLAPNILSITDTIEGYLDINNTPSIYSIPNVSNNFPTLSYVGLTIVPFGSSGVQERRNLIAANLAVGVEQNPQTYELKTSTLFVNSNEYVGYAADGTFIQTGGNNLTKNLVVGAQKNITGTYLLKNNAALFAEVQIIGAEGIGEFFHTFGRNNAKLMVLGLEKDSKGEYTLNVPHSQTHYNKIKSSDSHDFNADQLIVGKNGTAYFNHFQGTSRVSYSVMIGDDFFSNGTYTFYEGVLDTNILGVGHKGVGTLLIDGEHALLNSNVTAVGFGGAYLLKEDLIGKVNDPDTIYQSLLDNQYIDSEGLLLEKFYLFQRQSMADDLGLDVDADLMQIHKLEIIRDAPLHISQGNIIQKNGIHTTTALVLSNHKHSQGEYLLEGGILNTENTFLGYLGESSFRQTGGVHNILNDLYVAVHNSAPQTNSENEYITESFFQDSGYGKTFTSDYYLGGGLLNVQGNIQGIAGISNMIINGGTLSLGGNMVSIHNLFVGFDQNSAHIQADGSEYSVIDFNLGFGKNAHGTYTLNNGAELRAVRQSNIGYRGKGEMDINGGTLISPELFIGNTHSAEGRLTLNSGTVSIERDLFVGYNGSLGVVEQKEGNVVAQTLHVGRTAYSEALIFEPLGSSFNTVAPIMPNSTNGVGNSGYYDFGDYKLYAVENLGVVNDLGVLQSPNNPTAGLENMTLSLWFRHPNLWVYNPNHGGYDLANIKTMSTAWWDYGVASGWILATHEPEAWDIQNERMHIGIYNDPNNFPAEEWIHHTLVFGDGIIKEYINGVLSSERPSNGGLIGIGDKLQIGGWGDHAWLNENTPIVAHRENGAWVWHFNYMFPYNGDIDEVLIYDKALTDQEISSLYMRNTYNSNGADYLIDNSLADGILVYYPLDEAPEKGIVYDMSYLFYTDNKMSIYTLDGVDARVETETSYIGTLGKFEHKKGMHTTANLIVEPHGKYILDSGDLYAETINVQGTFRLNSGRIKNRRMVIGTHQTGAFEFSGDSTAHSNGLYEMTITDELYFGQYSRFKSVDGGSLTIYLESASVRIESINADNLSGLEKTDLVFSEQGNTLEAAGADLGNILDGFVNNFAFNQIVLAGETFASLIVVNEFINQTDSNLPEAVYINSLVLGVDSLLDLNGFDVYVKQFTDHGGEVRNNGGNLYLLGQSNSDNSVEIGFETMFNPTNRIFSNTISSPSSVPEPSVVLFMMPGIIILLKACRRFTV